MDEDRAYGAGRSSRTFTLGEAYSAAQDAAGLFLEYRDKFGEPETAARSAALGEVSEGLHAWADADEALNPHRAIGRDWRALRAAEARARVTGLRVSVPQPDGQGSSGYRADAGAWGSGRGVGAVEMEREA